MTDENNPVIWAMHMPFRKTGSPVVAGFGATVRGVIVIEIDTWTKLCADIPQLGTTKFKVGTVE